MEKQPPEDKSGTYTFTPNRLCRCGHPLGIHTAERCRHEQPCLADGCVCESFTSTENDAL